MKRNKTDKHLPKTIYLRRLITMLLCLTLVLSTFGSMNIPVIQAADTAQTGSRQAIKAHLMDMIRNGDWDPYSSNMTVEEFYALMELFDEGKLPLESETASGKPTISSPGFDAPGFGAPGIDEPSSTAEGLYIPREKFLFAGLSNYERREGSTDSDPPLEYDNGTNYRPGDDYPDNLDPFGAGYKRPPKSWKGVEVTDKKTNRVILVSEGVNDNNPAVAGNVIQGLFASYTGYYVKQVTIDGANINVLGVIDLGNRYIYYYLSAEGQNTQVSTTTLPEDAKFIVEYVPVEHQIQYQVKLEGASDYITNQTASGVVFYGSDGPTNVSWVDGIFGSSRPNRTTDGAYSFDVVVPYGYELQIFISIDMTIDIPYKTKTNYAPSFHVEIDHTGTKQAVHDAWLSAYTAYLKAEGFINDDVKNHITETDKDGKITLTWKNGSDENKDAHNAVLAKMAERINDFIPHNNGFPLGMYPDYTVKGEGGFKILPNSNSPSEHTMRETFYNHLVKADRTVTAVLKKQADPTFDVSKILQLSNGAVNRGSSAKEEFAFESLDKYDDDYEYHVANGEQQGREDDPLPHGAGYPNVQPETGSWGWNSETATFKGSPREMKKNADGTYSYTWLFQTNDASQSYYLDVFEVNGIAIKIPYFPLYNWQGSYRVDGKQEQADDKHPYYTETTLADGATLRLEFLLGWNTAQRHYRVTVTGARSNVVVTGLNLMQYNTGADEFSTYNLTGVYSDKDDYSQTAPAIEYYDKKSGEWTRKAQSNVVVQENGGNGIDYNNGDSTMHGANIRFKIADGYGNPYYMFTDRWGDPIGDQYSVVLDNDGNTTSYNPVKSLSDVANGTTLDSRYVYEGEDGYYYIRLTNQTGCKFALLTVVARTIKYTVRYLPDYSDGSETWNGFVLDSDNGLVKLTQQWMDDHQRDDQSLEFALNPDSMPSFKHDPERCTLWKLAGDENGVVLPEHQKILPQYDDNDGSFYDLLFHTMATIASDTYGTIRPKDQNKNYTFQNWILVNENFEPVKDENDNVIQFLGGAIDLKLYSEYAVKHTVFGNADTDVHVLRLMPVWKPINNPFTYNVVLNWVDNLGQIHAENFSEYWDEVVTEMPVGGEVYVFLNKGAQPLLDWIANHPTYTFWDDVNNAIDDDNSTAEDKVKKTLNNYLENGIGHSNYTNILNALMQRAFIDSNGDEQSGNDTFVRLGKDIFRVTVDNGTISIWMYENKGGLIFHKDVQTEPFAYDDVFYFTITNAKVGDGYKTPLKGEYKAYPEFVYDDTGALRERTDADAWLVKFENGKIVSINGDENITYFTLKSGEGIALYVAGGQYTIVELGSRSGDTYKVSVEYDGDKTDDETDNWDIPDDDDMWLKGSEQIYHDPGDPEDPGYPNFPEGISQVSATVNFAIGEANVVHTLIFHNQTAALSIEKELGANEEDLEKLEEYQDTDFSFKAELKLPEGQTPFWHEPVPGEDEDGYYYFDLRVYDAADGSVIREERLRLTKTQKEQNGETIDIWVGSITIKAGQRAVIIMSVPEDGKRLYDEDQNLIESEDEIKIEVIDGKRVPVSKDGKRLYDEDSILIKSEDDIQIKEIDGVRVPVTKARISYWLEEVGIPKEFKELWVEKSGVIEAGMVATAKVTNWYGEPPEDCYLAITETRKNNEKYGKSKETFLYKITKINDDGTDGEELIVSVPADGETIVRCPAGNYRVEEITDWAWRYEDGVCKQSMPINVNASHTLENPAHADFTNARNKKVWLGGENRKNNVFGLSSSEVNENVSSPYSRFMGMIDSIVQIFR